MKKLVVCFVLLFNPSLYAQNYSEIGSWYFSESIATIFPEIDDNHSVGTGDGWPNDLYVNHDVKTSAAVSVQTGFTWFNESKFLPFYSLGASYTYAFPMKVNGTIFQYSLPEFENYQYHYEIHRQTLLGIIKAELYRYHNLMPFLLVGLGVSANHIDKYQETPLSGITPRFSPEFQDETTTHFSYALGAGLDYIALNNLWLSLGYNFGYYGPAQTDSGISSYSNERLRTQLTDNGIVFTITYFLDKTA
ncbi:outer membrane protein [Legionella cardiaca]|uniref:Outer membrane protein beta-barrel domain-containing protein n=1 Tax=Legionella cardiaca TaxID=1071983 RepID=A0ABY8APU0_9GAMM|nr:hypothetical protein [Legionella cardiaca]WED42725.1 hypothetical protein PXX05_12595 [Legionella cardiaca]